MHFWLVLRLLSICFFRQIVFICLQGLTVREMEELREDIKMHLDLDRATPTHIEYWEVFCPFSLLF